MISRRVLPWIGGPSLSSSPGLHAELPDAVEHDRLDEHEHGHGRDDQDVPQRVDLLGLARRRDGEPVDQQPERDAEDGRDHADRHHLAAPGRGARETPAVASAAISSSPQNPSAAASYGRGATDGTPGADRGAGAGAAMRRGRPGRRPGARSARRARAVGAVVRRRDAEVAPERLRELGRLAVADAVRDLAHGQAAGGQQLGGLLHPDAREVVAEGGLPDLGVGALQLAAGGRDPARDLVEREVAAVLLVDDLRGLLEQARAESDRCRSLRGHVRSYAGGSPRG